jgi:hypothetical protein
MTVMIKHMFKLFKWLSDKTDQEPTPESVEETPKTIEPPILLRIDKIDSDQENSRQFLAYGWCHGIQTYLTNFVFDWVEFINRQIGPDGHYTTRMMHVPVNDEYQVRADWIDSVDGRALNFTGDTPLFVFMPYPRWGDEVASTDMLFGGPSHKALSILHAVALRLECRINTIETSPNGDMLVIFKPRDKNFDLKEVVGRIKAVLEETTQENKG